jgi:catalase
MTEWDRENSEGNVVSYLSRPQKRIQHRQTALFFKADPDYGQRVVNELDTGEVEGLAHMFPEDRMEATK